MTKKDRKCKFTAIVNQRLVAKINAQAAKLNLTCSDIVEQAMEMWLKSQTELEEEQYFALAANVMNRDGSPWNKLTSKSITERLEQ